MTKPLVATVLRRQAYETARMSWPTLPVSFEEFCAHLNSLGYERSLPPYLGPLYLCIACSLGQEKACRLVESRHLAKLRGFLLSFDHRRAVADELMQQIRCRLFVGAGAKISAYRGQGALDSWLRRIASSVALDFLRNEGARHRQIGRLEHDRSCLAATHGELPRSPDEHLDGKKRARRLEGTWRRALEALSPEQRAILFHYYVSELTIDQLAAMYQCNRSTAARRILRGVQSIRLRLGRELHIDDRTGDGWHAGAFAASEAVLDVQLLPPQPGGGAVAIQSQPSLPNRAAIATPTEKTTRDNVAAPPSGVEVRGVRRGPPLAEWRLHANG